MSKKILKEIELNRIYQRDCIEGMQLIPDKSVDMILCDLPYGTTRNKWDTIIPFEPLWEQYSRIIRDNGAIVLTGAQPFTSALVMSNPKLFKYIWTWDKANPTGFLNAKKQPLRVTEDIVVFYKLQPTYNPKMEKRGVPRKKGGYNKIGGSDNYGKFEDKVSISDEYYPTNLIRFSNAARKGRVHPTQKPVPLFEYLIKTYTNEGDVVLDNCMGSGTTAIACVRNNRNFIGFELEREYVEIANKRIDAETEVNDADS